jgi:hypothetical protein
MDCAEVSDEGPSTEDNTDKGRPPPIFLTSEANLLSLQKGLNAVVTGEFFRNTASGTRITTESMTDYKATQNLLSKKGLPFLTFYTIRDKPVKLVFRSLPSNNSSEDITVALQELGYEVISVKQMTAERPSPTGDTLVSLRLFLVALVETKNPKKSSKSPTSAI